MKIKRIHRNSIYTLSRATVCGALLLILRPSDTHATARETAVMESIKDVRILSPDWICAVVDPTAEILAVRQEEYGDALAADKRAFDEGKLIWWYWPFTKQFRMLNIQKSYHQPLFADFNKPDFWKLNDSAPADVTVWSHSVDGFPNWDANEAPAVDCGNYSRTADMVYLKPASPLKSGDTIHVSGRDGRSGALVFDDQATPNWSIKVNQSAYPSDAQQKIAYLGMWLPGIGPVSFKDFEGKPFHVKRFEPGQRWNEGRASGEPVLSGKIKLRMSFSDQDIKREGGANATGEDVYDLDFSELHEDGLYCIQIPGLGRSWPFRISRAGYADAFYTMMKGLFVQRCGIELKEPYTSWTRPECHAETHLGHFIPETEGWYGAGYRRDNTNLGFRDASGARISLSTFTLVGNEDPQAPIVSGVKGGWHDAGDFDRRIFHYWVVNDLLALYESFPERFRDNQLNIPESGNGIPDLLDEAAYGVEVWRRTQREDGAVSSWLEQESHPGPVANNLHAAMCEKQMAFFSSTPDRGGSLSYAAAAAWLGRLLLPHDKARGSDYIASAERAYHWASGAGSVMSNREFLIARPVRNENLKGQTIRFDEDPEIQASDRTYTAKAFAAAYLYAATKKETYLDDFNETKFTTRYPGIGWAISPSQCLPLLTQPGMSDDEKEVMRSYLLSAASKLVNSQEEFAYRTAWLSPSEGWFHTMAWGNLHAKSRWLVAAYAISRDSRYKAAMERAADFFLGCNPMGQTMVTGIGSVYPVVIQHIHSLSDSIADPTPGIAPYTFTFGISMRPFVLADSGHPSVKTFFTNIAAAFIPDKLGRAQIQEGLDSFTKTGNWTHAASQQAKSAIWSNMPVFRRKVTHPGAAVDQNEFTVNETISPLALLFGALTTEGWSVSDEVLHRKPRRTVEDTPYYYMP